MARITNFKIIALGLVLSFAVSYAANADFSANFASCIANNETKGLPPVQAAARVNEYRYTGIYQMGVNYVGGYLCSNYASIGKMPGTQDWSKCDFKGTLAKSMGITSYAAFTTGANAVAAQNYIMLKNSQATWNEIVSKGYDTYLGQTIGGVVMTQDTMVAMAHLKGVGGLKITLEGNVAADKKGTTTTGYASCLASCIAGTGTGKCDMKAGGANVFVNVCTGQANGATEDDADSVSPAMMIP